MDITNQTKRHLTISLPGGKKLRLGPGKTGQITPKAAAYPAVQKLVDAGDIAVAKGRAASNRSSGGGGVGASQRRAGSSTPRQTGDR